MKKKQPAPHEVVKSYVKVAQDRLREVFFTRPEWRKPATAKGVDLIISRIEEIYYPFSSFSNDKHKAAVWRQVLKEKRAEMLAELKEAEKIRPEHRPLTANDEVLKILGEATEIPVKKQTIQRDPGGPRDAKPTEGPLALGDWPKERIAQLRDEIKKKRCASKIARQLGKSASYVPWVLRRGNRQIKQIVEIADAYDKVTPGKVVKFAIGMESTSGSAIHGDDGRTSQPPPPRPSADISRATLNEVRSIVDFPQRAATLISHMSVDVKDGKLFVQLTVDVAEAIKMHVREISGEVGDAYTITSE